MTPKRKAEVLNSSAQNATWTVSMNNGIRWIDGRGKTRKNATLQCLSNVVDAMIEKKVDKHAFLQTALCILKRPEQNEDLWRAFALHHKKYQSQLQQLFHTVNTCIMKRDLWIPDAFIASEKTYWKAIREEKTCSRACASVRPIPYDSIPKELHLKWEDIEFLRSI